MTFGFYDDKTEVYIKLHFVRLLTLINHNTFEIATTIIYFIFRY